MSTERREFEKILMTYLGAYFENNVYDLLRGNILIEDDGEKITIYNKRLDKYDWCIVY